jgi:coenzyme F420-reducing hydrogenase alpha subunit
MTRLVVDPLTRVEGHGRVELTLKDGRLDDVKVRLLESPRLFESLVVGRHYDEVPDLVCRICAICSAAHKLTSLQALEKLMSIKVPPIAEVLRELLLLGGHLQSHALHLFCLILPDLCETPDLLVLLQRKDPLAEAGIKLKAFGNRIQEIAGGRVVHPVNPVFGGVAYVPDKQAIESLAEELRQWQACWSGLSDPFLQPGNYPEASPVLGNALATGLQKAFALSGETLCHGEGLVDSSDYAQLLGERSRTDSHAKDSEGKAGPFLTGALARARLAADRKLRFDMPLEAFGIHGNNLAQANEIGLTLQRLGELLEMLLQADRAEPLRVTLKQASGGVGTAATEAPRGLLIHHYVVDEWGKVVAADIVTPTAINQRVMAAQIMADLAEEEDHERLCKGAERIVRAYDPCISCAVHLVRVENSRQHDANQ